MIAAAIPKTAIPGNRKARKITPAELGGGGAPYLFVSVLPGIKYSARIINGTITKAIEDQPDMLISWHL